MRQTTPEKLLSLNELVCESIRFQGCAVMNLASTEWGYGN
jgi:hypothetical protein